MGKIRNSKRLFMGVVAILMAITVTFTGMQPVLASSGKIDSGVLSESIKLAEQIEAEGIVLLKNENAILPLLDKKVNVFGVGAYSPYFGASGSASSGSVKSDNCIGFYDALSAAGISYNESIYNLYKDKNGKEIDLSKVDFAGAKEFSDVAIVMISRAGMEGDDLDPEDISLSDTEKNVVDTVCNNFDHVVVLFNIANILEMGFLDEYPQIEGAAIIWTTGEAGMTSVGKMLTGEVNPSGKLTDSVAYHLSDYPTTANFGDFTYSDVKQTFISYEEGIYLGYRYFETFGVPVQYPFGYGLSYTSFKQELVSKQIKGDDITVEVKVTNTGAVAGKDVVEIYASVPYIPGGVEKSAIQLATFGKTRLLAPGESQTISLTFDIWDISSYDMNEEEAYILDPGTYAISLRSDVQKEIDSFEFVLTEKHVKKYDETTGVEVKNLFDSACYEGFTALSRSNPEETMPTAPDNEICPVDLSDLDVAVAPEVGGDEVAPTLGAKYSQTIYLQDVYQNPDLMDAFLDQLTLDETISLICDCGYKTPSVDRLGITKTVDNDGPASIKGSGGLLYKDSGVAWPVGACLAATWNEELAYLHGYQTGIEAKSIGTDVWYSPTANLHRNPMGGRNFEYFSEDPVITGVFATAIVKGAQKTGLTITVKHLVLNEQETNRWGALTWADEQTIREIYLRPFEKAIKEGGATGVMSAYSRLGKTWCGGNSVLIKDLLRGEWGYNDYVITDFSVYGLYGGYMNPVQSVYAQNDSVLSGLYAVQQFLIPNKLKAEYEANPVAFGKAMRACVKDLCIMKMNSTAFKNYTLRDNTFRIEGETGKVVGKTNKGSSFVEKADGASTGYTLCNASKKGNVITWTFNAEEEGDYDLTFALANTHLLGSSVDLHKQVSMQLNGANVNITGYKLKGYGALSFNHFDEYGPVKVHLQKGQNVITWKVIGGDCPNVDYMDFTKL